MHFSTFYHIPVSATEESGRGAVSEFLHHFDHFKSEKMVLWQFWRQEAVEEPQETDNIKCPPTKLSTISTDQGEFLVDYFGNIDMLGEHDREHNGMSPPCGASQSVIHSRKDAREEKKDYPTQSKYLPNLYPQK